MESPPAQIVPVNVLAKPLKKGKKHTLMTNIMSTCADPILALACAPIQQTVPLMRVPERKNDGPDTDQRLKRVGRPGV